MRNRTRETSAPPVDTLLLGTATGYNNGEVSGTSDHEVTGLFIPYAYSQETDDVVIPNFQGRRANGEIFNNPYVTHKTEKVLTALDLVGEGMHWSQDLAVPHLQYLKHTVQKGASLAPIKYSPWGEELTPSHTFQALTAEKLRAVTSAMAQMNDPAALAAVSLIESPKTARMLLDIRDLLDRANSLIKKGVRIQRAWSIAVSKSDISRLTSAWLQVRYGLRPLYYELKGLVAVMEQIQEPVRRRFRAYISNSSTEVGWATGNTTFPAGNNPFLYTFDLPFRVDKTTQWEVSGGVLAEMFVDHLSVAQSLGMQSPLQTVWELIPFSFVVDWFVNTSRLVASWDPKLNAKIRTWWWVARQTATYHCYPYPRTVNTNDAEMSPFTEEVGDMSLTMLGGDITQIFSKTERYPEPTRQIVPLVSVRLNVQKATDLLALAVEGTLSAGRMASGSFRY